MPTAEVESRRPYEVAMTKLAARVELERANGNRSFEVAASVADKILNAESLDDILAAPEQGPDSAENFIGKGFKLRGMLDWQPAAEQFREGGTGYYVVFRAVDMNGVLHVVSTGATNLVFQFLAMEEKGMFQDEDWESDVYFTIRSRPVPSGTLFWLSYA